MILRTIPLNKPLLLFSLIVLLTASSCARQPRTTSYPFSSQHKMQALNHWNILAKDTAEQLHGDLQSKNAMEYGSCIHIQQENTDFSQAFSKLLKSHLHHLLANDIIIIQDNLTGTSRDGDCLQITFSTQVVKHRTERRAQSYPGTYTFLTAAISVMRDFAWQEVLLGAGILADLYDLTDNNITHNEILITTEVTAATRLVSMRTDMYYINDMDTGHYEQVEPLSSRQFPLAGEQHNEL